MTLDVWREISCMAWEALARQPWVSDSDLAPNVAADMSAGPFILVNKSNGRALLRTYLGEQCQHFTCEPPTFKVRAMRFTYGGEVLPTHGLGWRTTCRDHPEWRGTAATHAGAMRVAAAHWDALHTPGKETP